MNISYRILLLSACIGSGLIFSATPAFAADPPARKAVRVASRPDEKVNACKRCNEKMFNAATGTNEGRETRVLTGSHLTQTYTVHGHHTDAVQPVYVIDRRDPRFAGGATLAGALRKLPFGTIGGH